MEDLQNPRGNAVLNGSVLANTFIHPACQLYLSAVFLFLLGEQDPSL
jgi:hypothetical protein